MDAYTLDHQSLIYLPRWSFIEWNFSFPHSSFYCTISMRMRPRIIALKKVVTDIPENGYDRYLYYNMNNIIGMYFVNPLLARFGIESVRDL